MKELLAVISLLVSGAIAEPPAPYAPSGWKPNGPAFELPQRGQEQQPSQYLPPSLPLDPRNPASPNVEYGTPEEDVSVQGLPAQEETPFFQRSPVNGKQNVGPAFNSDIKNLDQSFKQTQYQRQQQLYREFERQKQLEAQNNANRLPRPLVPVQFAPRTTTTTETPTTEDTTQASTTEISLNEGEQLDDGNDAKVSVEVDKQKIREYPGELFLSSLAQLQLQPQFVPLQQFGQIQSSLYLQPVQSQKQVAGYNAQTHFAALPSVLAQQQLPQPGYQSPTLLVAGRPPAQLQPASVYQPQPQFPAEAAAVSSGEAIQPQAFYSQPNVESVPQYPSANALQPQLQPLPQFSAQPVVLQPQGANQLQPQFQLQPQPGQYQPQTVQFPPQLQQPGPLEPQAVQLKPQQQLPGQFQPQTDQYQPQPQEPGRLEPQAVQFQRQPLVPGQFQPQLVQYQPQPQRPGLLEPQALQFQPQPQQPSQFQPQTVQFQPQLQHPLEPQAVQFQPQPPLPGQFQPQTAQFQPRPFQPQSDQENQDVETNDNTYKTQLYQQPFMVPQPANQFQPQLQAQPGFIQAQLINYPGQQQQAQFQPQGQFQPQRQSPDALQSGLDLNQQGNDLEEPQDQEDDGQDEGRTATAVATAFGARTQPRVLPQYGAPIPGLKGQAAAESRTTTESPAEEVTDDEPVIAQAVAIADGTRRKSAKLRTRRIRPVFTIDRSGHLVLAPGQ